MHYSRPLAAPRSAASRPALIRFALLSVLFLSLGILTGCGQQTATVGTSASTRRLTGPIPAASSIPDPPPTIRQSTLYKEAQQDCRAKRYSQAAALLEQLGHAPGLTPDAVAFCRSQRAICLRDAGMPVPIAPSVPVTPAPAVALTPEQADCGPRALALACARLHRPCTLPGLRRTAGTTAQGTTRAVSRRGSPTPTARRSGMCMATRVA